MLYFSDARGVDGVGTAFCSTAGVRVATVGLLSRLLGSFAQFFGSRGVTGCTTGVLFMFVPYALV